MTNSAATDELEELATGIRILVQRRGGERPPTSVLYISLAQYFNYNVTKGGFAQLLYNLHGEYLEEIEQMLLAAPAPVAHSYYAKAIRECLANSESYRDFLNGSYTEPNAVKDSLHDVSFAYFNSNVEFLAEFGDFMQRNRGAVQEWLQSADRA